MNQNYPQASKRIENLQRLNDRGVDRHGKCRLDKNERTVPFPEAVLNEIYKKLGTDALSVYPDQNPLYRKLADHLGLSDNQLLLTAGGDAAIKAIFETYVSPGEHVAYLWPTYAMIDVYAKMFGAQVSKFTYDSNLHLDLQQIHTAINDGLKLLILANPNQPSGTVIDDESLDEIIALCEEKGTMIVLDQAYIDFSKIKQRSNEINNYRFLFILRTFSKSYGLAGARLGYIASDENNIKQLFKVKPLSDINAVAIAAGEVLLENQESMLEYVAEVNQAKQMLYDYFNSVSMETIPSETNFIHIKPGKEIDKIYQELSNKGYLLRQTGAGLPAVIEDCLRISVGPCAQMQKFIEDFKQIIA